MKRTHVEMDALSLEYYKEKLNKEQFNAFRQCFEDGRNMFITGQAGSGKTFLVQCIRNYAIICNKILFVTALTGCAAVAIEGTTLHVYMGIGLGDLTVKEHIKKLSTDTKMRLKDTHMLVIDEISMTNPEYFQKCDEILRFVRGGDSPFGGVQLILVGDFLQLPPVEKKEKKISYIFQMPLWNTLDLLHVSLTYNHRQETDIIYATFLAKMRIGTLEKKEFDTVIQELLMKATPETCLAPHLYSRRMDVNEYNQQKLAELVGDMKIFVARGQNYEKLKDTVPVPIELNLKVGARVLLCKNIDVTGGLFNGKQGTVVEFIPSTRQPNIHIPVVEFDGRRTTIEYATWELTKHVKEGKKYVKEVLATFVQIPLILAYAITVHKTQGMTLEAVSIHGGFFASGHMYVAFSRAKTLEGVHVETSIPYSELKTDANVVEFYKNNHLI